MNKSLAMIEYSTVSAGFLALDVITKTAEVDILTAQSICPGKFMILFSGEISAVTASLDAARGNALPNEIDSFVLGNPHDDIFAALAGTTEVPQSGAIGLIETYSGASAIVAADCAAKTAIVSLAEIRLSRGMCGKSTVLLTGEIAAVSAALQAATRQLELSGMLLDTALVPNPDEKMRTQLF